MESQLSWTARLAFICYLIIVAGTQVLWIFLRVWIGTLDLRFPRTLVSVPPTQVIVLVVTLLFSRYVGIGLKELGLKKVSFRILTIVSVAAVLVIIPYEMVYIAETVVLGPNPAEEIIFGAWTPRDPFQLAAMIAMFLVVVGPCEELAFRGFVQKGFERSYGKIRGLVIASVLFGLYHFSPNNLYVIVPNMFIGMVFGYVWQKTDGNTTASALMHGVFNSALIAAAYFLL